MEEKEFIFDAEWCKEEWEKAFNLQLVWWIDFFEDSIMSIIETYGESYFNEDDDIDITILLAKVRTRKYFAHEVGDIELADAIKQHFIDLGFEAKIICDKEKSLNLPIGYSCTVYVFW